MGVMLERSGIASELLESISKIWGEVKGGLAYSVLVVGVLMAASTGIVGATVVTMGILSLPLMLKWKYNKRISTGIICASGTLGQIIPPSIVLVLLADIFQGANEQASQISGDLAPNPVSSVDLFAGAIIPGLILVTFYGIWIFLYSVLFPRNLPKKKIINKKSLKDILTIIMPPTLLIITVLGSILLDAQNSIEKCLSKNVCPEAFFDPRHKVLFQSFLDMDKEKNPMDAVTIKNWLNDRDLLKVIGGEDYLLLLQDSTIVPSHVESYSDIVMDKFLCRKLIKKSSDVIDSVYNSNEEASILVDKAQEALFSINYESDNNIQPWKDSIKAAFSDIENMDPNNKITGVNTGYIELNKRLSGFQKTDMIVIAARPGMGKPLWH